MPQFQLATHVRRLALVVLLLAPTTRVVAQADTTVNTTTTGGAPLPGAVGAIITTTAADGEVDADSLVLADSVRQVARWLVANGASETRARTVAGAIMRYARLRALDPLLVVGIIGVENASLAPRARSRAGARGVMQVMPSWKKDIPACGHDMHDVHVNVCLGTAVLRIALDASTSVREALLRYNGCVRAPGCSAYASAVFGRSGYALLMARRTPPVVERTAVASGER